MSVQMVAEAGSIELGEVRSLRVSVYAGDVHVVGAEGPSRLEVDGIEGAPLKVEVDNGAVSLSSPRPGPWRWLSGGKLIERQRVSLSVAVPPGCRVKVEVVSADVVVTGMEGRTSVVAVSGGIILDGLSGTTKARTVSGDVEGRALAGGLVVETVSGSVTVAGATGGTVAAKTVSGEVMVDLSGVRPADLSATTVSGDVTMRLPATAGARVDFSSASGRLASAFDELSNGHGGGGRRLSGLIGSGGALLRGRTVSGDIALVAN